MQAISKEIFQVSGDQPGQGASGMNLNQNALCNPVVLYRSRTQGDLFLTLDVFEMPGAPMYIVTRCPVCQARNPDSKGMDLTIKADQKAIDLNPRALPDFSRFGYSIHDITIALAVHRDDIRGRLSIEPFKCTWEAEPELQRDFGFSRCEWHVSIKNNIMRDER
jgi:hypothetical protein